MFHDIFRLAKTATQRRLIAFFLLAVSPVLILVALLFGIFLYVRDLLVDLYHTFVSEVPEMFSFLFKALFTGKQPR